MKTHIENQLINAGFERISTGGGCYAYCKLLADPRYIIVTDSGGIATDITDDNYIVGLEEEGLQLAYILRDGSRSLTEVENYAGNPTIDPSRDYATVSAALAAFGVQL